MAIVFIKTEMDLRRVVSKHIEKSDTAQIYLIKKTEGLVNYTSNNFEFPGPCFIYNADKASNDLVIQSLNFILLDMLNKSEIVYKDSDGKYIKSTWDNILQENYDVFANFIIGNYYNLVSPKNNCSKLIYVTHVLLREEKDTENKKVLDVYGTIIIRKFNKYTLSNYIKIDSEILSENMLLNSDKTVFDLGLKQILKYLLKDENKRK